MHRLGAVFRGQKGAEADHATSNRVSSSSSGQGSLTEVRSSLKSKISKKDFKKVKTVYPGPSERERARDHYQKTPVNLFRVMWSSKKQRISDSRPTISAPITENVKPVFDDQGNLLRVTGKIFEKRLQVEQHAKGTPSQTIISPAPSRPHSRLSIAQSRTPSIRSEWEAMTGRAPWPTDEESSDTASYDSDSNDEEQSDGEDVCLFSSRQRLLHAPHSADSFPPIHAYTDVRSQSNRLSTATRHYAPPAKSSQRKVADYKHDGRRSAVYLGNPAPGPLSLPKLGKGYEQYDPRPALMAGYHALPTQHEAEETWVYSDYEDDDIDANYPAAPGSPNRNRFSVATLGTIDMEDIEREFEEGQKEINNSPLRLRSSIRNSIARCPSELMQYDEAAARGAVRQSLMVPSLRIQKKPAKSAESLPAPPEQDEDEYEDLDDNEDEDEHSIIIALVDTDTPGGNDSSTDTAQIDDFIAELIAANAAVGHRAPEAGVIHAAEEASNKRWSKIGVVLGPTKMAGVEEPIEPIRPLQSRESSDSDQAFLQTTPRASKRPQQSGISFDPQRPRPKTPHEIAEAAALTPARSYPTLRTEPPTPNGPEQGLKLATSLEHMRQPSPLRRPTKPTVEYLDSYFGIGPGIPKEDAAQQEAYIPAKSPGATSSMSGVRFDSGVSGMGSNTEVCEKALKLPKVLRNILVYLSPKELLGMRAMSSSWNDAVMNTPILHGRARFTFPFPVNPMPKRLSFVHNDLSEQTLAELRGWFQSVEINPFLISTALNFPKAPTAQFFTCLATTFAAANIPDPCFEQKEPKWRNMLVTQPPATIMKINGVVLERENGITMGMLYDSLYANTNSMELNKLYAFGPKGTANRAASSDKGTVKKVGPDDKGPLLSFYKLRAPRTIDQFGGVHKKPFLASSENLLVWKGQPGGKGSW